MEDKKIKKMLADIVNSMESIKNAITGDSALKKSRDNALRYGGDGDELVIDTCHATDTGYWETGIVDERYESEDSWVIVEEYIDKDEATKGHGKWVKLMTSKKLPKILNSVQQKDGYKLK